MHVFHKLEENYSKFLFTLPQIWSSCSLKVFFIQQHEVVCIKKFCGLSIFQILRRYFEDNLILIQILQPCNLFLAQGKYF